jgi:threonine synthase
MGTESKVDDILLRCIGCGALTPVSESGLACARCDDILEVVFPPAPDAAGKRNFDADALRSVWLERRASHLPVDESGVWRFREVLPALGEGHSPITLGEGNTPLYELSRCASSAGVRTLYAKHLGMNPTGSFKDTGMTVAASFARQDGFRWVACASTGNTSASMAAYAARGGMRSLVLIPDGKISWSKLSQALDYGAITCQVKTDFDGCMGLLNEIVRRMPIYLLNSINPFRLEGQKTVAYELLEQFDWRVPDHVMVPGGNLGNCSALGKALVEMQALGLISTLPKLSVIQAEGANALIRTMRETGGKKLIRVQADTMATAIRIGNPGSWKKAVRVLEDTGGTVEQVSEVEIALAKAEIGADGIGCEPASAVTLAGLKKLVARGFVEREETVVLILTGHLLKDPDFTLKFHRGDLFAGTVHERESKVLTSQQRAPIVLDATVEAVLKVLETAEKQN